MEIFYKSKYNYLIVLKTFWVIEKILEVGNGLQQIPVLSQRFRNLFIAEASVFVKGSMYTHNTGIPNFS